MAWTFRILATLNGLMLAFIFFYKSSGEDPAGEGLRLAMGVFYSIGLVLVLLLNHFIKTPWVQLFMLALLVLPLLALVYGLALLVRGL